MLDNWSLLRQNTPFFIIEDLIYKRMESQLF